MTTQVIFKTDEELKRQAMEKAQSEGLTLKAVLSNCMKYYVEGKLTFGIQMVEEPEIEIVEPDVDAQEKMDEIATLLEKV